MIGRDVMRDMRERDLTARKYARANNRALSVAQLDRRDLIREVDRLNRELTAARHHAAEVEADRAVEYARAERYWPVVVATLEYHASEVIGNVIPGKSRALVRTEFDTAVEAYRTIVGLSGKAVAP